MKRIALAAALVALCVAAFSYTPARVFWDHRTHEQARPVPPQGSIPFVLDPATQDILSHADRVETFRLVDFHEAGQDTPTARSARYGPHSQFLKHAVLRTGQPQNAAFAATIGSALAQVKLEQSESKCFEPGVGYRIWKGQAHTDLCICFYCEGIELITQNADQKVVTKTMLSLGAARPAFLALSRQAFPQDKALAALKTS